MWNFGALHQYLGPRRLFQRVNSSQRPTSVVIPHNEPFVLLEVKELNFKTTAKVLTIHGDIGWIDVDLNEIREYSTNPWQLR